MKDQNFFSCYYFRHIIFVNTLDLDENQITFYDNIYAENNEIPRGAHICMYVYSYFMFHLAIFKYISLDERRSCTE